MKMHFLSGGRLRMRRRAYYLGAEPDATFELPVWSALIRHAQGNVLFDTGCSPRSATEPAAYWGHLAKVMTPLHAENAIVVHQLPKAGLSPEDIDLVICSHFHTDHCGCNAFFGRATVVCTTEELAVAKSGGGAYLDEDWNHPQTFDTFDQSRDVFGDGRLTLMAAPGHTPGMCIGHVVLDRHAFLLASDAVPVEATLEQRYAPKGSWDDDKFVATLDEIRRIQAGGATVIYGHDDAQWRSLRQAEAYYD
jgi:N-acyl homoserine lactone hydrolase